MYICPPRGAYVSLSPPSFHHSNPPSVFAVFVIVLVAVSTCLSFCRSVPRCQDPTFCLSASIFLFVFLSFLVGAYPT